ncbi:MAG: hypothetical protein IH586_06770 [Anaerolineaceae bacterium]|nr:hypothetical protein [Anaerolineaceae bacterium]
MPFDRGSKDRTPTSRADQARQRRSQQTQERVSTVGNRAVNPVRSRPVTVRGNTSFGSPIHKQTGTKRARRQFYLTMDQHGSELRLPALPVFHPGWRIASALLVILVLAGIVTLYSSPFFQIMAVDISGLQRISPDDMAAKLNLENLSIVEIDPQAITQAIATEYPELMDIQVSIEMPGFIAISAVERQPVMAWLKGDQMTWIDADGVIFIARGDAGPLLTIESEDDLPRAPLSVEEVAAQLKAAEAAAEADPTPASKPGLFAQLSNPTEKKEPVVKENVLEIADPTLMAAAQELSKKLHPETTLVYQQDHGLGWTDPQGWQVYIGRDLNQFEAKFGLYQQIASYLAEKELKPVLVSVEHLNAPFYRLEQ